MRKIAIYKNSPTSRVAGAMLGTLVLNCSSLLAVDALSPIERFIGNSFDAEEYSDRNLDQQKRFAPESPGDSDLGHQLILKRYQGNTPIRFDISTDIIWTDNITNSTFFEEEGNIWVTRANVSWKPRIGDNLFADLALTQSIYRHDSPSFLNFERTDTRLGLVKITPEFFDALFFLRYEYSRITDGTLSESIYNSHRIRAGVHKVFLSSPKHTAYVALDYAHELSATDPLERDEFNAHLGYTYQITDKLKAILYYHLTFYDYERFGREDQLQILGAEVVWQINKTVRLQASFTYAENESNLDFDIADFNTLQGGIGVGLTFQF